MRETLHFMNCTESRKQNDTDSMINNRVEMTHIICAIQHYQHALGGSISIAPKLKNGLTPA